RRGGIRGTQPVMLRPLKLEGQIGGPVPPIKFKSARPVARDEPFGAGIIDVIWSAQKQVEEAAHEPLAPVLYSVSHAGEQSNEALLDSQGHPRYDRRAVGEPYFVRPARCYKPPCRRAERLVRHAALPGSRPH